MNMSLQLYSSNHWIREHESSAAEINNLFAIADRDIMQSQTTGLGAEWRFDIAYNAALQLATAALAAAGYRAERHNKHMRTLESLAFTVGLEKDTVDFLDHCRRKRHVAIYEQIGAISDQEAGELLDVTQRLRSIVEDWICREHPS